MWGNAVRAEYTRKNSVRLCMQDGPMETVEYMWVSIYCLLIASAKTPECEGSISPTSFYGLLPN